METHLKKVLTCFIITPAGDEPRILHHPLIIGHNVSLSGPANPSEFQTRLESLACDFFGLSLNLQVSVKVLLEESGETISPLITVLTR